MSTPTSKYVITSANPDQTIYFWMSIPSLDNKIVSWAQNIASPSTYKQLWNVTGTIEDKGQITIDLADQNLFAFYDSTSSALTLEPKAKATTFSLTSALDPKAYFIQTPGGLYVNLDKNPQKSQLVVETDATTQWKISFYS